MAADARQWVEPTPACPPDADTVLTAEQVGSWRERGFALVDGVVPTALALRALADARAVFPPAGSAEAESTTDFGSGGRFAFPAESDAANVLTLHPRLLGAVAELLGVAPDGVRLTQSDLWAKYGRAAREGDTLDNSDQRMHVDYPNHSLTHPPRWETPEAVELILYLGDVDECEGATALVPRTGGDDPAYSWPIVNTPGVGALPWINDRESAEAHLEREVPDVARWREAHLYPREVHARYRVGTLLLYRHDTWHRGTPLAPGAARFAQNMTFRVAASEWVSVLQPGWAWAMYRRSRVMERLVATATVEQRCVLGFPAPGHAYWTPDTVEAVAARFGPLGMDVTPYARALRSGDG